MVGLFIFMRRKANLFLNSDVDPKEQVAPFYYENTNRTKWKYRDKVSLHGNDLTVPAYLGAIADCIENTYEAAGQTYGFCCDQQYAEYHDYDTLGGHQMILGDVPLNGFISQFREDWKQTKYSTAIQNLIEFAAI